MEKQEKIIQIIIRAMPSGDEVDVELSVFSTGKEIINALIDEGLNPRNDNQGNPYKYNLVSRKSNIKIGENDTLLDCGIENGDTLFFIPELVAGGFSGNMIYLLPQKYKVGTKGKCNVRIAKKELKKFILSEGYDSNEINEIEINNLMIVKLEENSKTNHFYINPLNSEEQIISDNYFSEWNFELIPQKIGFTSVVLKIIMPDIIEGFGEKYKDVFLLNKEVEITTNIEENGNDFINEFENVYEWTNEFKNEIYGFVAKNETGKALSKLVNFFQKRDLELLNAMIIFQSQWNEGRNKSLLQLISQNEWMMLQTKINFGILEIIKNIENKKVGNQDNLPIIDRLGNQIERML